MEISTKTRARPGICLPGELFMPMIISEAIAILHKNSQRPSYGSLGIPEIITEIPEELQLSPLSSPAIIEAKDR
jgi:hypothetical protein